MSNKHTIVYYGAFVTPFNTPMVKIDSDNVTEEKIIVTAEDLQEAADVLSLGLEEIDRERFFVFASLPHAMYWKKGRERRGERMSCFPMLEAAIQDGRVEARCSSVQLNIITKSKEEENALLEELNKPDMEVVAAVLFKRHAKSPMDYRLRWAKFMSLDMQVRVSTLSSVDEGFFIQDWKVFGPHKDKYGLIAKSITKCVQLFAREAWQLKDDLARSIHCLYVGDSLKSVDLNQWTDGCAPKRTDFPDGWTARGTIAYPNSVCVVLICPKAVCKEASALTTSLLQKFLVPITESSITTLDLSGISKLSLSLIPEGRAADITKLSLAECNIDIREKATLDGAIDLVKPLENLQELNLSYNALSGKRGIQFLKDLAEIRPNLCVLLTGTTLKEHNYEELDDIMKGTSM